MTRDRPGREPYVGRFAPSPTGPLHFGSLVAAVASWVDARAAAGRWLLRIEDVDTPRTVPGSADAIQRTLLAMGLEWDGEVAWQSRRTALYEHALEQLRDAGLIYRCRCSRKEVADSGLAGLEGAIYPGTCRALGLNSGAIESQRLCAPSRAIEFSDRVQGALSHSVAGEIGDFILKRRDGLHAYQLAVVVDDAEQGVTDVVRGADLLWSTPRQIALQRYLGYRTPRYLHFPVATNARGEKLSKQTLAPAIDGSDAAAMLAAALDFLGQPAPEGSSPAQILASAVRSWQPDRILRTTGKSTAPA